MSTTQTTRQRQLPRATTGGAGRDQEFLLTGDGVDLAKDPGPGRQHAE